MSEPAAVLYHPPLHHFAMGLLYPSRQARRVSKDPNPLVPISLFLDGDLAWHHYDRWPSLPVYTLNDC